MPVGGLLHQHQAGVREASSELVALVAAEIRRLAPQQARERRASAAPDDQLANLLARVLSDCALAPDDRAPFLAVYASALRRVLCEDLPQHGVAEPSDGSATPEMVLAVDGLLRRLERVNTGLVSVVECLYFARLTAEETAAALRCDIAGVQGEWTRARAWLLKELTAQHRAGDTTEVSVPNAVWADAVLRNALALHPDERAEFLTQFHAAAPGLRRDVEELLRLVEDGAAGVPLDEPSSAFVWSVLSRSEVPVTEVPAPAHAQPAPQPSEPIHIEPFGEPAPPLPAEAGLGGWRIISDLPSRGTGRLLLVERDADALRASARVLPALRTDGRAPLFNALCERLAAVRHPRIAPLLDSGVAADGSFYLVHAAAEGRPLGRYCARQRLALRDRVRLLVRVCSAVQEAHRSLVAHGALTDARILVDDHGDLTILDCGVEPLAATLGSDAPGTAPVSVGSDVQQAGEVVRDILAPRGTAANDALDTDLAAIVQLATRKDGPDRYRSIAALRSDLQRWLERRPVLARGSSRTYRIERFLVRRRVPLAIAAGLAIAAAVVLPSAIATRIESARAAARTDAVTRMVGALVDNRTSSVAAGPPGAATYVDRAAALVRTELAARPAEQSGMLLAIGRAYGDLGAYQSSVDALEEALGLRKASYGEDSTEVADVLEPLGQVRHALGRYDEAESTLRTAKAIRLLRAGAGQVTPAGVNVALAGLLHHLGRSTEAEQILRAQLAAPGSPSGTVQDDVTARARVSLATVLRDRGVPIEAERLYRQALSSIAPARSSPGPVLEPQHVWKSASARDLERARAQSGLAGLLIGRGESDEAATLLIDAVQSLRRLHGDGHPALLEALRTQGRLRLAQGRLDEARSALAEAQRIHQQSVGVFTLDVPATRVLQAELALRDGRIADAVASSRLVLDELERLELGDHPITIEARAVLGEALTSLGRRDEALQVLTRAISTAADTMAAGDPRVIRLRAAARDAASTRRLR